VSGKGPATVIHEGIPVIVHEQPAVAVTLTDAVPPAAANVGPVVGEIVGVQTTAADCDTKWLTPAIVIVALRAEPLLAATA
jgi:hypothetical protein